MRNKFLLFCLIITCFSVYSQVQNYSEGDTVDDFTVTDIDGNVHNLYSYTSQNKWVFLDFFFVECGGCQDTVSIFNEFYDKYGCNAGELVMISINRGIDNEAQVRAFEDEFGGDFHHAPAVSLEGGAGAVNDLFNPAAYPTYVLIGPGAGLVNGFIWPAYEVEVFESTLPFIPDPVECTLGLENDTNELSFTIIPNPSSSGDFQIRVNNEIGEGSLNIFNLQGVLVYSEEISQPIINISKVLNSGAYILSFEADNRKTTKTLIVK